MTSQWERQQRVRNGSRRKRDLAAVGDDFDYEAFAAQHFPDERPLYVRTAIFSVRARHHYREVPKAAEVQEVLEAKGWTRKQQEAL